MELEPPSALRGKIRRNAAEDRRWSTVGEEQVQGLGLRSLGNFTIWVGNWKCWVNIPIYSQWNSHLIGIMIINNPMVLLIIIPMKNGYFIGNINPTFSDKPIFCHADAHGTALTGAGAGIDPTSGGRWGWDMMEYGTGADGWNLDHSTGIIWNPHRNWEDDCDFEEISDVYIFDHSCLYCILLRYLSEVKQAAKLLESASPVIGPVISPVFTRAGRLPTKIGLPT